MGLPVFTPAPAVVLHRNVDLVNAGSEPVYAVRIGHHAEGSWGADLLRADDVIDVGDSEDVTLDLQQTCWYDVRIEYRDGHVKELDAVDLCKSPRLFLNH